jgi:hypothetical protein
MQALQCFVAGVGVWSPLTPGWDACRALFAGAAPAATQAALPAATWLPATERRRATASTRVVLSVAQEALTQAGWDAGQLSTVFASSSGSADITDELCGMLAAGDTQISPTKFHNSVHNAPAGYYSIAVQCRAPSVTLGGYDASAAMGLLDAAVQVAADDSPLLLVAFDVPYTGPLAQARVIDRPWGIALALAPAARASTLAALRIQWCAPAPDTPCTGPAAEALRLGNPSARLLPLLEAIGGGRPQQIVLAGNGGALAVDVTPMQRAS